VIRHSAPAIGPDELGAVVDVLRSGQLAQGAQVEAFEHECAHFLGRRYAVAVNSGTSALYLALAALDMGPGRTVALPSYVCSALSNAVRMVGGRPVLCDIGPRYNLDPATLPADRDATIVPHLFGAPADLAAWQPDIEDIAQSIGGPTGRRSRVAVASFYATKLLTTGEGGMLLTDDEALAEFARDRRDYDNRDDGALRFNWKMTDFQAALGRVQLKRLPSFIRARRAIARQYHEAFRALPMRLPDPEDHVFFRYVVATDRRDALEAPLRGCGIEAKRPVHRPLHHALGGRFPRAEQAHRECLSLPIYPGLVEADVARVIESVTRFMEQAS